MSINVMDFGAKAEGIDDTAAIQAALAKARWSRDRTLYFPGSNKPYVTKEPIVLPEQFCIRGDECALGGSLRSEIIGAVGFDVLSGPKALLVTESWLPSKPPGKWMPSLRIRNLNLSNPHSLPIRGIMAHNLGENSLLENLLIDGFVDGVWATGMHATATFRDVCVGDSRKSAFRFTRHPHWTGDGSGGLVKMDGCGGDRNLNMLFFSGSHTVTIRGHKYEQAPNPAATFLVTDADPFLVRQGRGNGGIGLKLVMSLTGVFVDGYGGKMGTAIQLLQTGVDPRQPECYQRTELSWEGCKFLSGDLLHDAIHNITVGTATPKPGTKYHMNPSCGHYSNESLGAYLLAVPIWHQLNAQNMAPDK